jgi:hypothetical protein
MKTSLFAKQLNARRMRIQLIADAYKRALKRHAANKEVDLKLVQMVLPIKEEQKAS